MAGECCICIGSITDPSDGAAPDSGLADHPVATKCGHLFHQSCLSEWLRALEPPLHSSIVRCSPAAGLTAPAPPGLLCSACSVGRNLPTEVWSPDGASRPRFGWPEFGRPEFAPDTL